MVSEVRHYYAKLSGLEQSWVTIAGLPFLGAEKVQHNSEEEKKMCGAYRRLEQVTPNPMYLEFLKNITQRKGGPNSAYVPLFQD